MKSVIKVGIVALLFPIWMFCGFLMEDADFIIRAGFLVVLAGMCIQFIVPGIIIATILFRIERAKIFRKRNYFLSAFLYLIASSVVGLLVVLIFFIFYACIFDRAGPNALYRAMLDIGHTLPLLIFLMFAGFLCGIFSLVIPPKKILLTSRSSRPEGRMLLSNIFI
jgi:hypothetical protein